MVGLGGIATYCLFEMLQNNSNPSVTYGVLNFMFNFIQISVIFTRIRVKEAAGIFIQKWIYVQINLLSSWSALSIP